MPTTHDAVAITRPMQPGIGRAWGENRVNQIAFLILENGLAALECRQTGRIDEATETGLVACLTLAPAQLDELARRWIDEYENADAARRIGIIHFGVATGLVFPDQAEFSMDFLFSDRVAFSPLHGYFVDWEYSARRRVRISALSVSNGVLFVFTLETSAFDFVCRAWLARRGLGGSPLPQVATIGPGTAKALAFIRDCQVTSPRQFARLMWPNSPGWSRHHNVGNGSAKGVGMAKAGGSMLGKLRHAGYITNQINNTIPARLTDAGNKALKDYEVKSSRND